MKGTLSKLVVLAFVMAPTRDCEITKRIKWYWFCVDLLKLTKKAG